MSESLISELSSAEEYEIPIIKKANIITEYNFLIFSINNIIEKIIEENKKNLKSYKKNVKQQSKMFFSLNEKQEIKLYDYLKRIYKYLHPEDSTLIISLILIDRFCCEAKLILTEYNIHRIIFTSILISSKFNEDNIYSYEYYSLISGVSKKELSDLEINFLNILKYNVFVNDQIYGKYYHYIYEGF